MGTLVFQATLGGQVNLSGPNTASTFTISVPAVTGNMITSGDTGTVTNTMLAGSIANAKLLNSSVTIGSTSVALGATAATIAGLTLTAPVLGTPTSVTLTNGTGLPLTTGVTGTLPTANGGTGLTSFTANGVVYASSTSALATGSALTFDGSKVAIATAGNDQLTWTSGRTGYLYADSAGIGIGDTALLSGNATYYNKSSNYIANYINGSEQMRLTSTGLGIGTSSPAEKLTVNGNVRVSGGYALYLYNATNDGLGIWYNPAGAGVSQLTARVNGADRLTIDSSGNLGLGVTPSAQYSTVKALQIGVTGGLIIAGNTSTNGTASFGQNWYVDPTTASYLYGVSSVAATRYSQYAGQHQWFTAPSGTAGNPITFTQAATLDASGNFMIGTTSTTGSASNDKIVAGGRFRTVSGSVSAATATATTLFTAPTALGAWLVTVNVDADATLYAATYLINTQGGSATIATLLYKGSLISVSVSGYNVQATQTSGGTATIQYSAVRIF